MNGEMTLMEKQQVIDEFVEAVGLYQQQEPLKFDLRGYARYVRENNIQPLDVTPEMAAMFQRA